MVERLHVLHLLYEPSPSGISRHVQEVVGLLPNLRHSVILPDALDGVPETLRALGAAAYPVPMGSRILPRSAWRQIPSLIRRLQPDLLHLHALEAGAFGTLAGVLGGAKRVIFSPQTIQIRKRALLPVLRLILRVAARRHVAWTVASSGHREQLRGLLPVERVHWVPNAVPVRDRPLPDRAGARTRLGWPAEAFVVAFVGRLSAQKDPWTFVRAAYDLSDMECVLVGDGPLRAELEPAVRSAPWVRLQGRVEGLDDVLAAADALCLPSGWEGMALTLLSALAAGLPVVASRIPGNTDLVIHGQTGLLVEPEDEDGLRAAIRRLAADPALRRRLGDAGRAHVEGRFAPARVSGELLSVYERALQC